MKNPFDHHSPTEKQTEQISTVRAACKTLNEAILALPSCRERSLAITKLEEVSMWANKGIIMQED